MIAEDRPSFPMMAGLSMVSGRAGFTGEGRMASLRADEGPNPKSQTPNKSQGPRSKDQTPNARGGAFVWLLSPWPLELIWPLGIGPWSFAAPRRATSTDTRSAPC